LRDLPREREPLLERPCQLGDRGEPRRARAAREGMRRAQEFGRRLATQRAEPAVALLAKRRRVALRLAAIDLEHRAPDPHAPDDELVGLGRLRRRLRDVAALQPAGEPDDRARLDLALEVAFPKLLHPA